MRVAVIGLAKSGTSALYSAIKRAMPSDTVCLFEPKTERELDYFDRLGAENALTKIMFTSLRSTGYSEARFDKNICIVRDPRDVLVSSTIFHFNRRAVASDPDKREALLDLFQRKERDPASVDLVEILEQIRPAHAEARRDKLARQSRRVL